jgi:hypothetical protein
MGTVTITAAGFANLGASPPANWPSSRATFPANGSPNGTKVYTLNDADWLSLLTWVAASQFNPVGAPATPTASQILLAWLAIWINGTKQAVQQYNTVPATVPPAIVVN